MSSILPIGVEELLSGAVESIRLEFKASWNPGKIGPQVIETITAFANDLQNLNGGYIIIGVAEEDGVAQRPVQGLSASQLDAAQKWIRGNCKRIQPEYTPLISPEQIDGKPVLIIWATASDARPHQAPDARSQSERQYFVREGSETIKARGETLRRLVEQTARIPFDDRVHRQARLEDLSSTLVREFLRDVGSALINEPDAKRIYELMRLSKPINRHHGPRNVALLMFSDDPEAYFPGARIELAQFRDEAGGDSIEEQVFRGPLHHQVKQCLTYLQNLNTRHIQKVPGHHVAHGWVSYPSLALREALVNAIYHRDYANVEPTKVYLYPDRIEITSYPGPVHGVELEDFLPNARVPMVAARNRRIGELLKELRLAEGRGTGIAKIRRTMLRNGSPSPRFEFHHTRTYFTVTLPAHPEFVALTALQEYAYQSTIGDERGALAGLQAAHRALPQSGLLGAKLIELLGERGELAQAAQIAQSYAEIGGPEEVRAQLALAQVFLNHKRASEAKQLLDQLKLMDGSTAFEAAIIEKRLGRFKKAHSYFEQAGTSILNDVRALHEFAQVKMKLADTRPRGHVAEQVRKRLLQEAQDLLNRVIQLDAPPVRHAWAWFNLGQVLRWLRVPVTNQIEAFTQAKILLPSEHRFEDALRQAEDYQRGQS